MSSLLYYLSNQINMFKKNLNEINTSISMFKQYQTTSTINAGDKIEIKNDTFDIDFKKAVCDVKYLDPDNASDTYDTYIRANSVSTISIAKDGSKVIIKNISDKKLTFLINIISL